MIGMTTSPDRARLELDTYRRMAETRDMLIRQAHAAGVSKSEIFRISGIARTTINRVLTQPVADATDNAGVMTPAEGMLTDRLARGEAVPGGPGACARPGCGHAKVWHSATNRRHPCEQCNCPQFHTDETWRALQADIEAARPR